MAGEPFDASADLAEPSGEHPNLRPRDAATLIIVRRDGSGPRVLMGRRASGHVFMAARWVFPGGRLTRSDWRAPASSELRREVADAVNQGLRRPRARALAQAAVRETFEETGLLLARPSQEAAKFNLAPYAGFSARGVAPDLAALSFVGRAITPPRQVRRFDARFFMADADALTSLDPQSGDRELDEIAWIELSQTAKLELPRITAFMLEELSLRMRDPDRPPALVRKVGARHVVERIARAPR